MIETTNKTTTTIEPITPVVNSRGEFWFAASTAHIPVTATVINENNNKDL